MHKVLARLFTITNNIKSSIFLGFDPEQCGISFGLLQAIAFSHPLRPKLVGFSQPFWLGKAACNCGFKHACTPEILRISN